MGLFTAGRKGFRGIFALEPKNIRYKGCKWGRGHGGREIFKIYFWPLGTEEKSSQLVLILNSTDPLFLLTISERWDQRICSQCKKGTAEV